MFSVRSEAVVSATPKNSSQSPSRPTFAGKTSTDHKAQPPRQTALEQVGMLMTIPVLLGVNGLSYLTGLEEPEASWLGSSSGKRLDLWA